MTADQLKTLEEFHTSTGNILKEAKEGMEPEEVMSLLGDLETSIGDFILELDENDEDEEGEGEEETQP